MLVIKPAIKSREMETKKRQNKKVGVAGSFQNQMMGNNASTPEVGKGATILMYSDREPYEVTWVSEDGNSCKIRPMDYKFTGSGYGDEQYELFPSPKSEEQLLEWNAKKQKWGKVSYNVEVQKSIANKLYKEHGYGWSDFLPVPYKDLIDGESNGIFTKLKLVPGITKEYKNFSSVSIIFGFADKYRDPHF